MSVLSAMVESFCSVTAVLASLLSIMSQKLESERRVRILE